MKIGVNFEYVRHEDRSFEYAAKTAAQIGFKYVEPCLIQGHCTLSEAGYCHWQSMDSRDARSMKQMFDSLGLQPSAVSAHAQLLQGWSVDHLSRALRFAAEIGAPIVNTAEGKRPSWLSQEDAMKLIEIHMKAVLQVAEQTGVYIGFEPHGEFSTNPDTVIELIEKINSPMLAINFDTGNTYIAGQDPAAYLRKVLPYVKHIHAKDISIAQSEARGAVTGTPVGVAVGEGEVDFKTIFSILKEHKYSGVLAVECGTEEEARRSYKYMSEQIGG